MHPLTNPPPHITPMHHPFQLFRLHPAPTQRDSETIHIATTSDVHMNRLVFRAPTLPTQHQFSSDLPFFINFRAKDRRERKST